MKIYVATSNNHKVKEISALLKNYELEIAPENWTVIEDGYSLKENALIKALSLHRITKQITISDDTGLFVESLNNRVNSSDSKRQTAEIFVSSKAVN